VHGGEVRGEGTESSELPNNIILLYTILHGKTNPSYSSLPSSPHLLSFWVNYDGIENVVKSGDRILLDDGAVTLECTGVEGTSVKTIVLNSGEVRSRVGVNLPGIKTGLPAMSDKDMVDIKYGMENDVDYIAASFVRDAKGVREIKEYVESIKGEGVRPLIISKIENVEGLDNFEEVRGVKEGGECRKGYYAKS